MARKPSRVIVNEVGTQFSVYSIQWIGGIGLIRNAMRFLLLFCLDPIISLGKCDGRKL